MGDMADDFLNDVIDAECRQIDLEHTPHDLWDEDDREFMEDRHPMQYRNHEPPGHPRSRTNKKRTK